MIPIRSKILTSYCLFYDFLFVNDFENIQLSIIHLKKKKKRKEPLSRQWKKKVVLFFLQPKEAEWYNKN